MSGVALQSEFAHAAPSSPYYLNDFMAVIDGVTARYADQLNADEHLYLAKLQALSQPARMLYARLVNRRKRFFRVTKLVYPEIGDVERAIEELVAAMLVERCAQVSPLALLECFTCPELKAALPRGLPVRVFRRAELDDWLSRWEDYGAWAGDLLTRHVVVVIPESDRFGFLRFLFFGELRANLADFVIRELGHVVTEAVEPAALQKLFNNRPEMDDGYRMALLYQEFRHIRDRMPAVAILGWWQAQATRRMTLSAGVAWFDRLVDRLGRVLERAGEFEAAKTLYATSPVAPARERLARLLIKSGDTGQAASLLGEMLAAPNHAQEAYAARQLLARLQRRSRRSEARDFEIAGETLVLDYAPGGVEAAVLAHYRAQGWHGVHSENWLWNASFGLLLWDIIYDPALGFFHSPFQFAPSDLHHPEFYARRGLRIEARLSLLAEPQAAFAVMRRHFDGKCGVANPFVTWHDDLPELLQAMLQHVPGASHAIALRHLGQNILRHSSGLPDLFLWNATDYRFVEIKAENDHLSGHQYEWLRVLTDAGMNVCLEKIVRPRYKS